MLKFILKSRKPAGLGRLLTLSTLYTAVACLLIPPGTKLAYAAQYSPEEIMSCRGTSVIGVRGASTGAGLLAHDSSRPGRVFVLTNSHIVGEQTSVSVFMSLGDQVKTPARVVDNLRVYDLAVLEPDLRKENPIFQDMYLGWAQRSLDLNTGKVPLRGWEGSVADEVVASVLNGRITCVQATSGQSQELIRDEFISGLYRRILRAPFFGRPGMSGGVYFRDGYPAGLLTQVDVSPSSISYVIPLDEAARALRAVRKQPHLLPVARWVKNGGTTELQLTVRGQRLKYIASLRVGGETSNSGGETSNSGGGRRARFWKMDLLEPETGRYGSGYRSVWWNDPFVAPLPRFLINDEPALLMSTPKAPRMLPSLARFVSLPMAKIQMMDSASIQDLVSVRAQASRALDCVGTYEKTASRADLIQFQQQILNAETGKCPRGKTPFSSLFLNSEIEIAHDLSKLEFALHGKRISLVLSGGAHYPRTLYCTSANPDSCRNSGARAVLFWNERDLAQLERILIQSGNMLYEITTQNTSR